MGEKKIMKKSLRALAVLGVAALSLASCSKTVSYADFKDAVSKLDAAPAYTSVTINGKLDYKSDSTTTTYTFDNVKANKSSLGIWTAVSGTSATNSAFELVLSAFYDLRNCYGLFASDDSTTSSGDKSDAAYTYSTGNSFKVTDAKDSKHSYEWASDGFLSKMSSASGSLTFKFSK